MAGINVPNITTGAVVHSIYAERTVPVYAVHETELDTIGTMGVLAAIFIAAGTSLLSFAAAIWTNASFTENMTPAAEVSTKLVSPVLCVLAVGFILTALWAYRRNQSLWAKIKQQSHTPAAAKT